MYFNMCEILQNAHKQNEDFLFASLEKQKYFPVKIPRVRLRREAVKRKHRLERKNNA